MRSPSSPDTSPKYRQVFESLRKDIFTGRYQPGQKLPSEAELVKRFGASRITVGRAMRELHQRQLITRRAGSGTFVRVDRPQGLSFGLLIPELGTSEIFEPIVQGMSAAPQSANHAILRCSGPHLDAATSRQDQAWHLCQQYLARQVSGVFFSPLERIPADDPINHRIIAAFEKARVPIVLLDRDYLPYPQRSRHDLVGIDNRRTGYLATEHLIRLGAKRIAFLSFPQAASTVDERIAGYREALYFHGLPVEVPRLQRLTSEDPAAVRAAILASDADAFVCANDPTAGRLMHGLHALGKRVPQEVRIVGIDDVTYASLLPIPLTTIHQPCHEIGMAAMAAMIERLQRPEMPCRDILLECRLVVRESCGAH